MVQPTNITNPFGPDSSSVTTGAAAPALQPSERDALAVELQEGAGALQLIPAGSTNGTPIGVQPQNAQGVRLYAKPGDSVSYTIAGAQPTAAPAAVVTFNVASGGVLNELEERLSAGEMIYVTAIVGTPEFRWY